MCEIGLVLSEINYMLRHIRRFAKDKTVYTNLAQFASRSYVKSVLYGVTLIISPWNYPFLLSIEPLVDALAAGNTVIIKPSDYSAATSEVIAELISNIFPREYVAEVLVSLMGQQKYLLLQSKLYLVNFLIVDRHV